MRLLRMAIILHPLRNGTAEREWTPREFQKPLLSVWRMSPTNKQYLPARVMPNQVVQGLPAPSAKVFSPDEEKNIAYDTYVRFLQ